MKFAIKSIEYILSSYIKPLSIDKNDAIIFDDYISNGSFEQLYFTPLTATIEEDWQDSPSGKYSTVKVNAIIRVNKDRARIVLKSMLSKRYIFKITDISGAKYIVGSSDFSNKIGLKFIIQDITTSEYQLSITCKSTHGLIIDLSV